MRDTIADGTREHADGHMQSVEEWLARMLDPKGFRFERRYPTGRIVEFDFRRRAMAEPSESIATSPIFQRPHDRERAYAEIDKANKLMDAVPEQYASGVTLFDAERRLVYANGKVGRTSSARCRGESCRTSCWPTTSSMQIAWATTSSTAGTALR